MMNDHNDHEVRRLRRVYEAYGQDEQRRARWSKANPGNAMILDERWQAMQDVLLAQGFIPLTKRRVLDVGCGTGHLLADLEELDCPPDHLFGIDLLPNRVNRARELYPHLDIRCGNAEALPYGDNAFDLVLTFTVFSSILDDDMAERVAGEIWRVLKIDGGILWYDFRYNNPWNPHTRKMTRRKVHTLFPEAELRLRPITLVPGLARRLGRMTPWLYPLLSNILPLRTHLIGLIRKRG